MHGKKSDQLSSSQFACNPGDTIHIEIKGARDFHAFIVLLQFVVKSIMMLYTNMLGKIAGNNYAAL